MDTVNMIEIDKSAKNIFDTIELDNGKKLSVCVLCVEMVLAKQRQLELHREASRKLELIRDSLSGWKHIAAKNERSKEPKPTRSSAAKERFRHLNERVHEMERELEGRMIRDMN